MILFVITQQVPPILLLILVICLYLSGWTLKDEPDLEFQIKVWWVLFVLLLHVLGLLSSSAAVARGLRRRGRRAERASLSASSSESRSSLPRSSPATRSIRSSR